MPSGYFSVYLVLLSDFGLSAPKVNFLAVPVSRAVLVIVIRLIVLVYFDPESTAISSEETYSFAPRFITVHVVPSTVPCLLREAEPLGYPFSSKLP